jgi:hypothetical protein
VFINGLRDVVAHSEYLFLSDGINVTAIESPEDCDLLQADFNFIQVWCTVNSMKHNIGKTKITAFSRKTKLIIYRVPTNNYRDFNWLYNFNDETKWISFAAGKRGHS